MSSPPSVAPRTARRPNPSIRLGNWELLLLLGEGRWNRVYQARPAPAQGDHPADYAVKVARHTGTDDDLDVARALLRRETKVSGCLSHPHLVPVLSTNLQSATPYLVMPFLEGATVDGRMQQVVAFALSRSLWIARQAAEALEALHSHGWLHSDVKPSNLHVASTGHLTLLDLGFAQPITRSSPAECEPLMSTLEYTAPERLVANRPPLMDRSDIYSLGITLFQMLTGRLPFEFTEAAHLAAAHLEQPPPDLRHWAPQVPQPVAQLVRQMLAKEPLRRPDTNELVSRLVLLEIDTLDQRAAVAK